MTTIEPAGVAEVLAILGHGEPEPPVAQTAAVIARLDGGEVRQVRLAAGLSPQQAARQVMRALHQPRTVTGVLAGDEMSRPLWQPVAQRSARSGAELVVLHVFDARTVPKFWDQHAHAGQAWGQEFLARYCALPRARLELRSGAAAEHVVKVAGAEQADMIALAWSQRLEPGRALVVRRAVLDAGVPVMLVPMPAN